MPLIPVLLSLGAIALTVFLVIIVRRVVYHHVAEGHNDVLVPIFLTAGTIYAVFLAFIVVAVWEDYGVARANIGDEASAITTIYRASTAMDQKSGEELRQLLKEYTEAVVNDEWRIQAETGGASEKARNAGLGMFRMFGAEEPAVRVSDAAINQTILGLLTRVQTDRNLRTLQAGDSLSGTIWFTVMLGGSIVIIMSAFLYMDKAWPHVMMSSVLSTMIVMLLAVTYLTSRPFVGPLALEPAPFEHSLSVFKSVDKSL
jgi:hypothetical protein